MKNLISRYTQKQVDEMLANAGVLTGKDAEIFLKKN